jgi:ERO1-like protein beta
MVGSVANVVLQIDPKSIVSDACSSYAALESLNSDISPSIESITKSTDFFAYYRLNLFNKECPYWSNAGSMCGNRACAVDTLENEDDIPPVWRAEELSKLEGLHANHPGRQLQKERPKARPLQGMLGDDVDESCVVEYDDECDERDYCIPEDEGAAAKGDYVSLVDNTERFTGYAGPGARQVWDAIYSENCFSQPPRQRSAVGRRSPLEVTKDLRSVMQGHKVGALGNHEDDLYPLDDECLEQRAFYRIISGMHASISTHLCWDYFNQTTGEWVRNLQCYKERLHEHPERVSNLYFNYALVTRAIAKLQKHLEHYTFCLGDPDQDSTTKQKVIELIRRIKSAPTTFDETLMFQDPAMLDLKEDFRNRFRNVSRLMDCVGCDKCRLWGKLQTAGYGAALKVLFEFDETKNGENPHLRRTELVALVNTLARISHSLNAIQHFRSVVDSEAQSTISAQPQPEPAIRKTPTHQAEAYNDIDEFEDFPLEDEEEEAAARPPPTLSEEFWTEIDLVWRAYKYVLSSWISLPFKTWAILVMELNRLWSYWLGLPVPPRSWDFRLPTRDEL